ncbi:MAG: hypothetical protein ABW032_11560 [Burkholderiaceae bacterium]
MRPRSPSAGGGSAPTFVLLSGHNDRAVVTLCRFFRRAGLRFAIVAAGRDDAIHRTDYADAVVFNRLDRRVTVEWLAAIADGIGGPAVHCPTTEFVNDFVLANRDAVTAAGWIVGLPARRVYEQLTGKLASRGVVERLTGVRPPPSQPMGAPRAPCVLKPRVNVIGGRVLYPIICADEEKLARALADPDLRPDEWFAQEFIDGQSRYLCAYLAADGRRAWFWQDNLLQQPGGKSIVLARTGLPPAFDTERFLDGLAALGYRGPLMMEIIEDPDGGLHYIEINPRFWGPLQLALVACPRILTLFAADHGAGEIAWPAADGVGADDTPLYYAWLHGARMAACRRYPAADSVGGARALERALERHDVYAAADTLPLHGTH